MEQTQKEQGEDLTPAPSPSDGAREGAAPDAKRSFWQRRPVVVIGTLVLFVLLFYGLRYLAESLTHEPTDDAFLDANVVSVAPKVAGQVKQVHVKQQPSGEGRGFAGGD